MGDNKKQFRAILKSKFVKSVFLRAIPIYLVVCLAIVLVVSLSFSKEINKNVIADRQTQLSVIENSVSQRMSEATKIANAVGNDNSFAFDAGIGYTGAEMTDTLNKYLTGNDFIEYVAFYRISEADKIYTTLGEMSLNNFLNVYLKLADVDKIDYMNKVTRNVGANMVALSDVGSESYFTYVLSLPKFGTVEDTEAFVIMLFPVSKITPLLERQFLNGNGAVAIYDSNGKEIYKYSSLDSDISLNPADFGNNTQERTIKADGDKYVLQIEKSQVNSWSFVSAIRQKDIMSGLAQKELVLVILMFALMMIAVIALFISIIVQYKPISNLADSVADGGGDGGDERTLLSDKFAVLKGDSEQKQVFEAAYHEAEAANKAKSAFLSSMSHDIRTPMNAIIGMTEIAAKNLDNSEYVSECLGKVQVASQYLLDIINNVLDMSRIESGRFSLSEETIDLPKLVYGLKTILNQSITTRHQQFVVEVENITNEQFVGDSVRLTQVFVNILSNSVKFTPNGGTISLNMSQSQSSSDANYGDYTFVFKDDGIGMAPDFVEHVFDTFSRAQDADAAKVEGTGLGMAIVKNLVELMGGSVACESEKGVGTTFTVKLHMKLVRPDNENALSQFVEKYKNMPALIIGDDERACLNQVNAFKSIGMNPYYTKSLDDAAKRTRNAVTDKNPFVIIVVNKSADDETGIKTAAVLANASKNSNVIIAFASHDLTDVKLADTKDTDISVLIQTPLFRSTIIRALDSKSEIPAERVTVEKKVVDLKGKKVLLVEDNNINREIASKIIGETCAEIFEAENGEEAVNAFKEHPVNYFDVILMDLQMPVMNGYEATSIIRHMSRSDAKSVPIYAMTANTFDEDVRQVKEAGMNGHIGKPYTAAELYKTLGNALNRE